VAHPINTHTDKIASAVVSCFMSTPASSGENYNGAPSPGGNVQGSLHDTDSYAVSTWVDKYCRENPLKQIQDAAASLVNALSKAE
jgi:hypothetical protein